MSLPACQLYNIAVGYRPIALMYIMAELGSIPHLNEMTE